MPFPLNWLWTERNIPEVHPTTVRWQVESPGKPRGNIQAIDCNCKYMLHLCIYIMWAYICIISCIHTYVYIYIYIYIYDNTYYIYIYIYLYIYIYIISYTYIHTCIYMYMHRTRHTEYKEMLMETIALSCRPLLLASETL